MSRTYAIADLHGRYDLLSAALMMILDNARAKSASEVNTLVMLGDYVDRGPQSREIIETLMTNPLPGFRHVCLKGNHEAMMAQCVRGQARIGWWLGNGGGATLISYGQKEGDTADPSVVPAEHLAWIDGLPLYHVDQHRLFVHAGVEPSLLLAEQDEETLLWKRYLDGFAEGFGERHVVHGHHQFHDGPKLYRGRTNLDTFAWNTGRLVVGVFDDDVAGGPINFLEIGGPEFKRRLAPAAA